jgi:N-methylhydantoinase B
MARGDIIAHKAGAERVGEPEKGDPITTEVVRHALNSAANQMKRALVRTSFSPVIYEVLDFAVAIYDRDLRLLAQSPTMPHFMGTLSFCIAGAVEAIGGEEKLLPGDVILYNWPYGVGAHAQDLAVVVPVFLDGKELIGYAANKAHWLDIGGKDPYSTDTVDIFQEGTIYPGVRLYRGGEFNEDVYRIIIANSRVPKALKGDLDSQITGCRVGAAALEEVVKRFGVPIFRTAVEHMFDYGEKIMRSYFEKIPDGRYVASGQLDNDGLSDDPIPFELAIEIEGSDVRLDFSKVPPVQKGPFNTPLPSTISVSRVAMTMLAGFGEAPNEGHFRPLTVITREDSMFHPLPPAPCFLYGWPGLQAIEVIYQAISKVLPKAVPASSGGCICSLVSWGTREATGEPWADGAPHPVGQGAWDGGDGGTMMYISQSATRLSPMEVCESRNPWIIERIALAQDSCGPGQYRGGLGLDLHFRMLEDTYMTPVIERTKNPPWGLEGGGIARANNATVIYADGSTADIPKTTRYLVPKGAVLKLTTGGGGGYGKPGMRESDAVRRDLKAGYISPEFAALHYPHAL